MRHSLFMLTFDEVLLVASLLCFYYLLCYILCELTLVYLTKVRALINYSIMYHGEYFMSTVSVFKHANSIHYI